MAFFQNHASPFKLSQAKKSFPKHVNDAVMKRHLINIIHFLPKLIPCIICMLLLHTGALAQSKDITVTGKVNAATGETLAGVTIKAKNAAASAVTDAGGNFSITVADNAILVVSYVGYKTQEVPVAGKTTIQINLQVDVNTLGDVVVVGYTTQKKKDLTGSVTTVNANDINGIPVGGVDQILQGKAAGVTVTQTTGAPGDGVTVRVRGLGTPGNNDPLYIIDGVPTKDGINEISPNDIETITVLKDASAASIYGARASNGVVIVTTKKGKTGKPQLNLNAYTGTQTRGHLIKMANTAQYVNAYNIAAANDGRPLIPLGMLDTLPDVNWQKEILHSAPISNVQLSLSGGSESTKYLVSAAYFTQKGMIDNSSYDRFNIRTSVNSTINSMFKVGTNINLAYNKTRQVGSSGDGYGPGNAGASVMRYALFRTPATPVLDKDGNYVDIPNPPTFFGDGLNPVGLAANTNRNFYNYSVLGDVFVEVTPVKHLKLKTDFGTNFIITDYKQFYPTWGSPTRLQNSPNSLVQSNTNNFNYNWTNTATYDWTKDKHAVNLLAGTEIIYNQTSLISASNSNFPNQTATFQYLNNATGTIPGAGGNRSNAALSSVFGRVDYQYDNKYLAAFNVRRDGSSRLDPSNRWGNFYSGSVGWRIDKEKFMQNVKFISALKLRGSYGQLGNQEINNYAYATLIGGSGYYAFNNTGSSAYTIYQKGNPDVKWESSTMTDVGLDIGLFNGAITITADYYRRITNDLLVHPPDPTSAGSIASPAYVNNGKILNRGFEFNVGYHSQAGKDWKFDVSANLATVHNEVLALVNNQPIPAGRVDNNVFVTSTAVGHSLGEFYLLEQEGIFQNNLDVFTHAYQGANIQPGDVKFRDVNGDGIINQDDRVYAGSPIPKFSYGFTGDVTFKSFDLNLFFQGVSGNKIYNQVNTELEGFYRPFNITEKAATESWTGEGTSNTRPRLSWTGAQNNKLTSTRFLESGSYLRLKNVQLGYTFSKAAISRLKVSSVRVYISAQNLFTITKYTGLDPEMAVSANAAAAGDGVLATGIDWGTYPSSRTFTAGININF
jgi:TonB-dependent starch-binding outer membrane protein SusC